MESQRKRIDRSWFSNRLKSLGRSQSDLADHLGLDRSAVTHMLKGTRKMDQYEILGTARFLDANPADVVLAACGEKVVNGTTSYQSARIPKTPISEPLAVKDVGDGQAALHVDMTIPWSLALDVLRLLRGAEQSA
jgi:hypothetical protein